MNKKYIIKDKNEFNEIIHNGKILKNKFFIIYIMKAEENNPKFGFAVGKKIGNAAARNKLKRQLRDIVRKNLALFSSNKKYIIMPKRCSNSLTYDKLLTELIDLVKKGEKHA